ncbi:DUF3828 domain-containing protein [Pantoea vagans]|uniref:DUF3828 domain-containing protein n=1 Tax=Pantoea vagans TaxID=470934 RepID=UPI002255A531|nr:DUF3828 domain-containing protein [Pantoea vagans]MCX3310917.1 DUF3828 domain-containing protein [Pantoea vagans]
MLFTPLSFADSNVKGTESAALYFNKWYVGQLMQDKSPLTDYSALSKYVTSDAISALKKLYSGNRNDVDVPDADMFIKAQDSENDWNQVSVISSDFDPVCTNVYISFGAKKEHVVADCMKNKTGIWKVSSVTLIK